MKTIALLISASLTLSVSLIAQPSHSCTDELSFGQQSREKAIINKWTQPLREAAQRIPDRTRTLWDMNRDDAKPKTLELRYPCQRIVKPIQSITGNVLGRIQKNLGR